MISVFIYCKPHPVFPVKVMSLGRDVTYAALEVGEVTIMSADEDVFGFADALERAAEEIRLQAVGSAAITDSKMDTQDNTTKEKEVAGLEPRSCDECPFEPGESPLCLGCGTGGKMLVSSLQRALEQLRNPKPQKEESNEK